MKKLGVFLATCIAAICLQQNGSQTAAEDVQIGFNCHVQGYSNCAGAEATSCSYTCQFQPVSPGSQSGVYRCMDENQEYTTPGQVEVQINSFGSVVKGDEGFCELMDPSPPVFCMTVYQCDQSCTLSKVGELCARVGVGQGLGSLIVPEYVDPETPCPFYCD